VTAALTCPAWCVNHRDPDEENGECTAHIRRWSVPATASGASEVDVELQLLAFGDGQIFGPEILVSDEFLTAAEARQLAGALLEAADLADQATR
jgi:hypothetical protein